MTPSLNEARLCKPRFHFGLTGIILMVFCSISCCASLGLAGGLLNIEDSWLISPSMARRLLQKIESTSDHHAEILCTVSQGRLFSMSELGQRSIALEGVSYLWNNRVTWAGSWQKTGQSLFVENRQTVKLLLGLYPALGLSFRHLKQTLAQQDEPSQQQFFMDLQTVWILGEMRGTIQLHWPLLSSDSSLNNSGNGRRMEVGKVTLIKGDLGCALAVDRLPSGKPNLGFHLLFTLVRGVGLEFRIDSPTGSLGPGVSIVRGGLMLRTSHVVHPQLGVTHRLALVLGRFGGEGQ